MPPPGKPSAPLTLEDLSEGFPHIPPECGTVLVQSAVLCLEGQGHKSGARLLVDGDFAATFAVTWAESASDAVQRFWHDLEEATQQGAYAVAIALIRTLTGYTIIERSRKGTGFDWWLGTEDNLFQGKARLEVSGILRGTTRRINSRIK